MNKLNMPANLLKMCSKHRMGFAIEANLCKRVYLALNTIYIPKVLDRQKNSFLLDTGKCLHIDVSLSSVEDCNVYCYGPSRKTSHEPK